MQKKGKLWNSTDDELLKRMVFQGVSLFSIAKNLGRTEASIRARASTLQLPLRSFGTRRNSFRKYG
jgi:hypothetical protein